jgi:hypothetical protein
VGGGIGEHPMFYWRSVYLCVCVCMWRGAWGGVRTHSPKSPSGRSQIVIGLYTSVTVVTVGVLCGVWRLSSQVGICF